MSAPKIGFAFFAPQEPEKAAETLAFYTDHDFPSADPMTADKAWEWLRRYGGHRRRTAKFAELCERAAAIHNGRRPAP